MKRKCVDFVVFNLLPSQVNGVDRSGEPAL